MRQPRADDRGILDPARLRRELRFRRHLPAPALRPWVEHYWLVDWALTAPFTQQVVPHPAVNVVFRQDAGGPEAAEVAGVGRTLFTVTLTGTGTVSGIQFRPGGFRPFWRRPVAELTDRHVPLGTDPTAARAADPTTPRAAGPHATGLTTPHAAGSAAASPRCEGTDDERRRALDAFLLAWAPQPDPATVEAITLAETIRTDRSVLRVDDLARRHGLSVRRLQRLFLDHVGVGPKWVIRRYRLLEAIEQVVTGLPDWATLAADLGYSDQAHLARDFAAVTGRTPTGYARSLR
ncbi:Helix-turn-helix domain-containing protein [Micromonospora matsumotoense]|uniref:Helix-turn-helix domain-containing protein n=1 Tax=Micromonospora matsumotoense TaxID=121616 RepID=A0A1C4XP21_9ACTN|nr:AraC family transcriptional regulator [Micromonospora matsumotoense]SCF10184.1 Helix-turn-helix domain-containing protein [Micromonospora matsumotoense]